MSFGTYNTSIIHHPKKKSGKPAIHYALSIDDNSSSAWLNLFTPIVAEGSFISARVTRVGGTNSRNDLTTIRLRLSDETAVKMSFEHALYMGLTHNNPYGVMITSRKKKHKCGLRVETLTFGFPQPLYFETSLMLQAHISDRSVERIFAEVIYNSSDDPGDTEAGSGRIEE